MPRNGKTSSNTTIITNVQINDIDISFLHLTPLSFSFEIFSVGKLTSFLLLLTKYGVKLLNTIEIGSLITGSSEKNNYGIRI